MAARAIWKGVIRFEDVEVPVKLYSAAQDRSVHFRLLHDADHARLEQKMVHGETGEPVPRDEVQKAVEVAPGTFVVLTPEELEAAQPESDRTIAVEGFVDPRLINHQWYDRPYYLGPDGDERAYFAFARALAAADKEGVAHWVMRKKSYLGVLRAEGEHLVMITMRHAGEVVEASKLHGPPGEALDERELKMAEQLVEMYAEPFDPAAFTDEYRERVLELVARKAAGEEVEAPHYEPPKPSADLVDALSASLQQAREGRKSA